MSYITYRNSSIDVQVNIRDEADESVAAEIFKLHEYRVAEKYITDLDLPILDVGAHAGFFTLYARTLNKTVPIIALEPEPNNLATLRDHLQTNNIPNVTVVEGALTAKFGKRQLEISPDSHNHKLSEKNDHTIVVQGYDLQSLTNYFPMGIGLMKMDIEGGEYEVFEHLTDDEYTKIRAIVMEYHDLANRKHQEIEKLLREHGFGVQTFPSKFDKTMGFFWATNKRH